MLQYTVYKDVPIPMRDKTILKADVYLPKDNKGPFPAILERTAYNKTNSTEIKSGALEFFTSKGYVLVTQDVRGRFKSEGKYYPFLHDAKDGYDTIEWIAKQSWCSGKVGTIGGSHAGMMQYLLAPTQPPHLSAMFVREAVYDHYQRNYTGGAFELAHSLAWSLRWTIRHIEESNRFSPNFKKKQLLKLKKIMDNIDQYYNRLPLYPVSPLKKVADWLNDFLLHPSKDLFWDQWKIGLKAQKVNVPIFHLGGWYDIFLPGTLGNFIRISQQANSLKIRRAQKLMIGPWVHLPQKLKERIHGELDFGKQATININDFRLRWFDYWLKGVKNGVMEEKAIRLFVMGINKWQSFSSFPPENTHYIKWYLHSSSKSNLLSIYKHKKIEQSNTYIYDPQKPVLTKGGATLDLPNGPYDQKETEKLTLNYTGKPLKTNLTIIGPVYCIFYASSSAKDTDWVVKLTDVYPDGKSMLICDGILRARYRTSFAKPRLLIPEKVYKYKVILWPTANVFKKGHCLRISITSSNFPRFDRNLNTGGLIHKESKGVVAINTIYHQPKYPSHIILPVVILDKDFDLT